MMNQHRTLRTRGPLVTVGGSLLIVAVLIALLWQPWAESSTADKEPLVLYCAAGIIRPVEAIAAEYEKLYGTPIQIEPGGSGALLSKIRAAPDRGDLYLSADALHVDMLQGETPPRAFEMIPVAWQTPVLAVSAAGKAKVSSLDSLLNEDVKVSLANSSASIGMVSEKVLTETGHWPRLQRQMQDFRAKVSLAGTVNEVAQNLQIGVIDAGIVWDATAIQYGLDSIQIPELDAARQQVQICVLSSAANPTSALRFARFLTSRDLGGPKFAAEGYRPIDDADLWTERPTLTLLSGAMLRPGVEQTLEAFQRREGVDINVVYNGCGILVTQMRSGTRPDAYFSCDVSFMEQVQDLFEPSIMLSENDMVILVPKGSDKVRGLGDLSQPGVKVGLGHPENSALGALTQQLLERSGHFEALRASGNIKVESPTGDFLVNQVVTGALDATIVYRSNALANPDNLKESVDMVAIDAPGAHAAQPIAIAQQTEHKHLSERLLAAVLSDSTRANMEAIGFRWKGGAQ